MSNPPNSRMLTNVPSYGAGIFHGPEHLEQFNREIGWNLEFRQLAKGGFQCEFTHIEQNGISITAERFSTSSEITAEAPVGVFGFIIPLSAGAPVRVGGKQLDPGHVVLFPSGSEMKFLTNGPSSDYAIHLREREFIETARSLFPQVELSKAGICELAKGNPGKLDSLIAEIRAIESSGKSDESESFCRIVNRSICWLADAASVSEVRFLTNNAGDLITRKAREYIEENYRDPIDMAVLCREVGAGVRSVQRSFAENFQMSPLAYLKSKRLNEARRELLQTKPGEKSISEVALDNGFTHLGRFSVDYRAYFGEHPKDTLQRT